MQGQERTGEPVGTRDAGRASGKCQEQRSEAGMQVILFQVECASAAAGRGMRFATEGRQPSTTVFDDVDVALTSWIRSACGAGHYEKTTLFG
jgi:hypothetical protein